MLPALKSVHRSSSWRGRSIRNNQTGRTENSSLSVENKARFTLKDRQSVDCLFDAHHAHATTATDAFAAEFQSGDVFRRKTVEVAVGADKATHNVFTIAARGWSTESAGGAS